MKRNNELIRNILLELQDLPIGSPARQISFEKVRPSAVNEHLVMLHDQRFIDCVVIRGNKGELIDVRVKRITATGREFLDQAKQPALWKETVAKSGTAEFGDFVRSLRDCVEAAAE